MLLYYCITVLWKPYVKYHHAKQVWESNGSQGRSTTNLEKWQWLGPKKKSLTILLSHCITVLLHYCITALLYYCITVLLKDLIVLLYYLYDCMTV